MEQCVNFLYDDTNTCVSFLKEEWRYITNLHIENINNWYMISNYGRVYSKRTNKFLKPCLDNYGYLKVGLYSGRKQLSIFIHRLVLLVFNYNPNHKTLIVNHIDGKKINNMIYNLEWCTPQENVHHAISLGLFKIKNISGENNMSCTITEEQANQIGCMYSKNPNMTYKEIGQIVGCSEIVVSGVCKGKKGKKRIKIQKRKRKI